MKILDKSTTNFVLSVLTIALAIRWVLYGITADDLFAFLFIVLPLLIVKLTEEDNS
ncbi:hypothetical protein [Thermococcus aciditolerans]|uniref:hypothetical protein n=1 Tax=Thermococcus aciditolerans TaxID=2598455 RepID=UPI00143D7570|nr:hypothetical protein [Thermococcus aciditolerans]